MTRMTSFRLRLDEEINTLDGCMISNWERTVLDYLLSQVIFNDRAMLPAGDGIVTQARVCCCCIHRMCDVVRVRRSCACRFISELQCPRGIAAEIFERKCNVDGAVPRIGLSCLEETI